MATTCFIALSAENSVSGALAGTTAGGLVEFSESHIVPAMIKESTKMRELKLVFI